jgi:hypothetical protein
MALSRDGGRRYPTMRASISILRLSCRIIVCMPIPGLRMAITPSFRIHGGQHGQESEEGKEGCEEDRQEEKEVTQPSLFSFLTSSLSPDGLCASGVDGDLVDDDRWQSLKAGPWCSRSLHQGPVFSWGIRRWGRRTPARPKVQRSAGRSSNNSTESRASAGAKPAQAGLPWKPAPTGRRSPGSGRSASMSLRSGSLRRMNSASVCSLTCTGCRSFFDL